MCILCCGLNGEEHWTDARVGQDPFPSVRARRRALLERIFAVHGLRYSDDPSGLTALISDRKGHARVARGLGEVWAAGEQLAGHPLDPLAPDVLARLRAEAEAP